MAGPATTPQIILEDTTLRDGLQMEARLLGLSQKRAAFQLLQNAGFKRIQVGSFVHPQRVPQMADTDRLVREVGASSDVVVSVLVLNAQGLARALDCGVRHAGLSVSVSDTHSRRNTGQPAVTALQNMVAMIPRALAAGIDVVGGLQCAFGCVWEGPVDENLVIGAADRMVRAGARTISLADTTGMATPYSIRRLVQRMQDTFPGITLSLHLHDTRGLGLANMFAGYEMGVRSFDVCAGGLGGCPFVKGAAGNIPAEDAVNMFESMHISTGINLPALCEAVRFLEKNLGRPLTGHMCRVLSSHVASST